MSQEPPSPPPTALVTGASRGLGRGIALELARAGFSVAVHFGRAKEAADETVRACSEVSENPGQVFFPVGGDVGDQGDRERLFAEALGGLGHLDALVNNAGMTSPGRLDLLEATVENWSRVMAVNLEGPFFLSQLAARYWVDHPGGSRTPGGYKLVFVSSISSFAASVNRGDYCVSKAALPMVNQLWAARLAGHGVQTVELVPGIMLTDMTTGVKEKYDDAIAGGLVPQGRWGTAEDAGKAVRAFLGGDFPFTTGDRIHLDGGFHLRTL